jgi:hypothetical protein
MGITDLQVREGEVLPASNAPELDVPNALRQKLVDTVETDWEHIIQAQADLAKGLWIKEYVKDKDGKFITDEFGKPKVRVYQQKPDKDSGQYLINQVIGKPKENMVVAGKVNFIMDI